MGEEETWKFTFYLELEFSLQRRYARILKRRGFSIFLFLIGYWGFDFGKRIKYNLKTSLTDPQSTQNTPTSIEPFRQVKLNLNFKNYHRETSVRRGAAPTWFLKINSKALDYAPLAKMRRKIWYLTNQVRDTDLIFSMPDWLLPWSTGFLKVASSSRTPRVVLGSLA